MSSSPSEFLTFFRLASRQTLRSSRVVRPFSTASARFATKGHDSPNLVSDKGTQHDTSVKPDIAGNRKHAVDKGKEGDLNVQSEQSSAGRASHGAGTGGSATSRKDDTNSTAKAHKEHPEAPDTIIGMQDERGGKGI